jgi:hypothetical protein
VLLIGDADTVRPEHTVELFRLLGGGAPRGPSGHRRCGLAVLPGTTHTGVLDRVDWLASMIRDSLAQPEEPGGRPHPPGEEDR